jgi:hypothetical protein
MDSLDLNTILNRTHIVNEIKTILSSFDAKCKDVNFKKGIYIYGSPGTGKTQFVMDLLTQMNYDVIKYDAGDVRNKSLIDTITSNNVSSCNVLNMMNGNVKKIAIVMDEIDGMYNGDKGGITSLIHLIRQKKTKRQKQESVTLNPIICIGNYFVNKKIKELIKVCHAFELEMPTQPQIKTIVLKTMPNIKIDIETIYNYVQGDIRKLMFIQKLYSKSPELLNAEFFSSVFHNKSYNDDANLIVKSLFQKKIPIENHSLCMNETERTIVAYLWHENIVEYLKPIQRDKSFPFYLKIIDNMCFADYTDRLMFQNQIWGFTEMSSLMKTFYNNKLYHDWKYNIPVAAKPLLIDTIRFTKILTKYSTEYSNLMFLFKLCQTLDMDKKDMLSFFQELRLFYGSDFLNKSEKLNDAELLFEDTDINKSVIKRIYRYLDKNMKPEQALIGAEEDDGDLEFEDD